MFDASNDEIVFQTEEPFDPKIPKIQWCSVEIQGIGSKEHGTDKLGSFFQQYDGTVTEVFVTFGIPRGSVAMHALIFEFVLSQLACALS